MTPSIRLIDGALLRVVIGPLLLMILMVLANQALAVNSFPETPHQNVVAIADNSFCELCDTGTVTVRVRNPTDQPLTNVTVTVNLTNPRLQYAGGLVGAGVTNTGGGATPSFNLGTIPASPGNCPTGGAGGGNVFDTRCSFVEFSFNVVSQAGWQEALAATPLNRNITATTSFNYYPDNGVFSTTRNHTLTLPIREPKPTFQKAGRNVDAGMTGGGHWAGVIHGHQEDGIVWRVIIGNNGGAAADRAPMYEVVFDDNMPSPPTNMHITHACRALGDATAIANGAGAAGTCTNIAGRNNTITGLTLAELGYSLPIQSGDTRTVYFAGRLANSCVNNTNTASNLQWGCPAEPPVGGISTSAVGNFPSSPVNAATVNVLSNDTAAATGNNLQYAAQFAGLSGWNGANQPIEPVGARGLVRLRVRNLSGGTVKGIRLSETLPPQYRLDPTFEPVFSYTAPHGGSGNPYPYNAYAGRVSAAGFEWVNRVEPTGPQATWMSNPDLRTPIFELKSTDFANENPDQADLLRHGDEVWVSFRIVLVDEDYFDKVAHLDVDQEHPASQNSDPASMGTLTNNLRIDWEDFCATGGTSHNANRNQTFVPDPEDLDIFMTAPLYIVRDTGTSPLQVRLINNGGHTAANYSVYVTFGQAMSVVQAPAQCAALPSSAAVGHPLWNVPDVLPASATVYRCNSGGGGGNLANLGPGANHDLNFAVERNHGAVDDDLTFRADVVGEIWLSNNTQQGSGQRLLWPTPADLSGTPGTTPGQQLANNYTLDGIRSRVLGFNLLKRLVPGSCTESDSLPPQLLIGEDCRFEVFGGGWFGFDTPGFTLIRVDEIAFGDALPAGQGYIEHNNLTCNQVDLPDQSAPHCGNAPGFAWSFIQQPSASNFFAQNNLNWTASNAIEDRNHWFLADMTTRLLNAGADTVAAPNIHGAPSVDYGRSHFRAVFSDELGTFEANIDNFACVHDGPTCNSEYPGYPQWPDWTVQLQVTEPRLHIAKEVCNFSRAGGNLAACDWQDDVDGSRFDDFIYRLTVENRQDVGPSAAPAYDVVIYDALASPQMCVWPFDQDGLDNTPEGNFGLRGIGNLGANNYQWDPAAPDADIHCRDGGEPAHITFSYDHSAALQQINAGQSVSLYYRVSPHRTVVPNQVFGNTVRVFRYDSLSGAAGNQNNPQIENSNHPDASGNVPARTDSRVEGGARVYCVDGGNYCPSDDATMRIISVDAEPKAVLEISTSGTNHPTQSGISPTTPVVGPTDRVDVVVGEEVRFRLIGTVPASQLRNLTFRDELPAGLACIELDPVDLATLDSNAQWFGSTVPVETTCNENVVEWRYGNQFLQSYNPADYPEYGGLFPIQLTFVARVQNSADTAHGATLTNPGGIAQMTYEDQNGNPQQPAVFEPISLNVLGPRVTLVKAFSQNEVDADDVITVTVTATNENNVDGASSATAYNLQILDDLRNTKYRYVPGSESGPAGLLVDFLGGDPDAPIFRFSGATETERHSFPYAVGLGETVTFSFDVRVVGENDAGVDVAPHEQLQNTIQARWQSLPHRTLALNASGQIGVDGALDGMRIGVVPNAAHAINDYEISANDSTLVPGLTFEKQDVTGDASPESRTIGSHREFSLEIRLPEGVTDNVQVSDDLAAGQISYVLANRGEHGYAFRCEYDDSILAINASAPAADCSNFLSLPSDGDSGTVLWNIGQVATHTENDNAANDINPVVRIRYFARIDNHSGANVGHAMNNRATLDYQNRLADLIDVSGVLNVAEPTLSVDKQNDAIGNVVSGDTVTYTVTITNASGPNISAAYDVNIVDTLAPQLQYLPGSATLGGAPLEPQLRGDGALVWGREAGSSGVNIPAGGVLVLEYQARVLSAFGGTIVNNVYVDWTSLAQGTPGQATYPGDYQRHGEGCPTITAPNNYCNQDSSTLTTQDASDLNKTALSTAWGNTDQARIGDTVEYRLQLLLGLGTTEAVVITDVLPAGLQLLSVDSNSCASSSFTCSQNTGPTAGATGTLQWLLGDVEAHASTLFEIVYTAVVTNDAVYPQDGSAVARTNNASLTYQAATTPIEADATITVLQPQLGELLKSDTRAGVNSPYTVTDLANEVMNFRLQTRNVGGAPAYGVVLVDILNADPVDPEFDEASLANIQAQINGQPAAVAHNLAAGVITFTLQDAVPAGALVTLDYQVALNTTIASGHNWFNRFHVDAYTSLDTVSSHRREYGDSAPACIAASDNCFELLTATASPQPLTVTVENPLDGRLAIGASFSYRIRVPELPITGATLRELEVVNSLDGLAAGQLQIDTISVDGAPFAPVISGDTLTFELGDLPPNSVRDLVVSGWLVNHPANQAGVALAIGADYSYSEAGSRIDGQGDNANLTVLEPQLALVQTLTNLNGNPEPQAGDHYHLSLQLSEQGAAHASAAHDLSIVEALETGWVYVPGSATFNGNPIADPALTGDGVANGQSLQWLNLANSEIGAGATGTVAFELRVLDSALIGQTLEGNTTVQWTSQAGAGPNAEERDGSDMPDAGALNNYFLGPESFATAAIGNDNSITKQFFASTSPLNAGELRIGDIAEYRLVLALQRGSLVNAAVRDTLPSGLVFVDTLAIEGSGITYTLGQQPQAGDSGTLEWALGTLVNSSGDELVIRYRARVQRDVLPLNAASEALTNNAALSFDGVAGRLEVIAPPVTVDALQPNLSLALSANPDGSAPLQPGDTVTFTATLSNSGTAPAYDPVLRDVIPEGMRQNGVSTLSVSLDGNPLAGPAPQFDAASGQAVWNLGAGTGYAIPPGSALEVVYRVTVDSNVSSGLQVANGAFIEWYYSFDDNAVPSGAVVDNRQPYGPTTPLSVQFNTPEAEPLTIAVQPASRTTVSIGEPFVYRLTIPAVGALHDVEIRLDLTESGIDPVDLAFVGAQQVSGNLSFNPQGTVDTNGVLTLADPVSGIDIQANDQAVIDLILTPRNTPTNVEGNSFTLRASYTYGFVNDNPAAGRGSSAISNWSAPLTLVEPLELVLTKSGNSQLQSGLPGNFTLSVENRGTGPAWDIALLDILPNPGLCETSPANFSAQISGTGLAEGSDFAVAFDAANCRLNITTQGGNAQLPAGATLTVSYQVWLDADSSNGDNFTNVAGITNWWSWDHNGPESREYTRPQPTDGTPAVEDHEDAHTVTALVPSVTFSKALLSANPASPGDTVRYRLTLVNESDLDVDGIVIRDELGRLNSLPLFAPGSLGNIQVSGGSNLSNASGGAHNSGLLHLEGLTLAANGSLQVEYDVTLAAVIDSGTIVYNQAELQLPGQLPLFSDDPVLPGDEDATEVRVESAPQLLVEKVSSDLTDDPDILMVGDTLRYTLTIRNLGDENLVGALLRDQVPANTTYVPGSTTLNGAAVADAGGAPLASGISIQTAGEAAGVVLAEALGATPVVVTFDVTINQVADGTVIANQGFVTGAGAGSGPIPEKPSDDPATPEPDDPTLDVVGDVPVLINQKAVALHEDFLSPGIVDPGDVLMYTITINNRGGVAASGVVLTDQIPAHTTYVPGSTTVNGNPVADVGANSPLTVGLAVNSDGSAAGEIAATGRTTVQFLVEVAAGTPTGTVIRNQGNIRADDLPLQLTDADGNPANGAQPTEIVVGDAQQVSISKEVAVVGGGAALPGSTLEYLVRITNIGAVPATQVVIRDDLLEAGADVLRYVEGSAQLNGQATGVVVSGSLITATLPELAAGAGATLRFRATLDSGLPLGFTVTNRAEVQWNDPPSSNEASVSLDVGGTPGSAMVNGVVWHDINVDEVTDGGEPLLEGWRVQLYFSGNLQATAHTDANGEYSFAGLLPNSAGGAGYELRFAAPGAVADTASLGLGSSPFVNGPQRISEVFVASGANVQALNLPISPNGVVYNAVSRQPIAGATLTLLDSSGNALAASCFEDSVQRQQVTPAGGFYKFDLLPGEPGCASSSYLIAVTAPGGDVFEPGVSRLILPLSDADSDAYDVPTCSADAVPGTPVCEVQEAVTAPPLSVPATSPLTHYYLKLAFADGARPANSQIFNNHIPLDPVLSGAVTIRKTAAVVNVSRGQFVPYVITVRNGYDAPLSDLILADNFPAGFKYVSGSARINNEPQEPDDTAGRQLLWRNLNLAVGEELTLKLLFIVGSGVSEGEYINRAQVLQQLAQPSGALADSSRPVSDEATAAVRVVPDPDFDCTDIIGKVFDDANLNGYQDEGERGLPGVRLVTARGLQVTTDAQGRFHITCAVVPDENRGGNFILKVDDRTLPTGYRFTTENPLVQRATRGKMIKFNFGAALHRVVGLDLADDVFLPGGTQLRPQWQTRVPLLMQELERGAAILRLAYMAETESKGLVEQRLRAIKRLVGEQWADMGNPYELTIETEVFWRTGAPPARRSR